MGGGDRKIERYGKTLYVIEGKGATAPLDPDSGAKPTAYSTNVIRSVSPAKIYVRIDK